MHKTEQYINTAVVAPCVETASFPGTISKFTALF
jgi:hypothetical protein